MATQAFEIAGAHKRTEQGNNDWYYGGGNMGWNSLAEAKAGVPLTIRPGKTVGIIVANKIVEYIWHPNDTTDSGLVLKTSAADPASVSEIDAGTDPSKIATPLNLQESKYLDRQFTKISATTTGSSTAFVGTLSPTLSAYVDKQLFIVKFHVNCGPNPTLNMGPGAKQLRFYDNSPISDSNIVSGQITMVTYDASSDNLKIIGALPSNFFDGRYIINTPSFQSGYIYLGGSIGADLGFGGGGVPNPAAHFTAYPGSTEKGQLLLAPGSADYTGSVGGVLWNNNGEIKYLDQGIVNRVLKAYNNELFKSDGNYSVGVNQYGDFYAVNKEVEAYVYDTDLITAITGATYTNNEATISVAGKTVYAGQKYYDETNHYMYEAWDDNKIFRR